MHLIKYLEHCLMYICVGAYGEVRKCLNKNSKALRAVKIINKSYLA